MLKGDELAATTELASATVDLPLEAMPIGTRPVAAPGTIYLFAVQRPHCVLTHHALPHALCLHEQAYPCYLLLHALLPQQ